MTMWFLCALLWAGIAQAKSPPVGSRVIADEDPPGLGATLTAILPNKATMEFVGIAPGTFTMGSPASEPGRYEDEGPQRQVVISKGFYPGKYDSQSDPTGPASGSRRVVRGGYLLYDDARSTRSAYRFNTTPDFRYYDLGARLLRIK